MDIEQLLKNAIEKHKDKIVKPILDKDGDEEDNNEQINRLAIELARLERNNGVDSPLKLFELYYNRIIHRAKPLTPIRQFDKALKNLEEGHGSNELFKDAVKSFCSQPVNVIIEQFAELIAYQESLDELNRQFFPNMYNDGEDLDSNLDSNYSQRGRAKRKPFNVKTYMEENYPGGLKEMFNYWKNMEDDKGHSKEYFLNENATTFIDRCNNTSGTKVAQLIISDEVDEENDRLILIGMLRAIQDSIPKRVINFSYFVSSRFGFKIWDKTIYQHKDKEELTKIIEDCKEILKKHKKIKACNLSH